MKNIKGFAVVTAITVTMAYVNILPRVKSMPELWVRIIATEVKEETAKAFLIHFGDKEA